MRNQTLRRIVSALVDLTLVNSAFVIAYWMRYIQNIGGEVSEQNFIELSEYAYVQLLLSVIMLSSYLLVGLYRLPRGSSFFDELITVLGASSIGMMLTLAAVFLFQGFAYSRWLFFFVWALTVVFLWGARISRNLLKAFLRRRGIGVERVLVVGGGELGKMLMHVISTEPGLGYHLIGFVSEDGTESQGRFRSLGSISELAPVLRAQQIDEVVIALPPALRQRVSEVLDLCEQAGVACKMLPDLYEMSLSRVSINELRGIPLIEIKKVKLGGYEHFVKRAFDIAVSLLVLVVFSPLWLLIGIAIKLDSAGPVVFRQTRLGKSGRPFAAYKFRSMRVTAEEEREILVSQNEATGPLFKMRNDPRVTRVGRFLRRTSLDEIPQFINVLRGEMSLVGPRPPLPEEVEQYQPWHYKRLEVEPGLTGLWQVSGRSDLPFDEMVMLDIYYIENWSLSLDFKILLRTIPAVLTGQGAY